MNVSSVSGRLRRCQMVDSMRGRGIGGVVPSEDAGLLVDVQVPNIQDVVTVWMQRYIRDCFTGPELAVTAEYYYDEPLSRSRDSAAHIPCMSKSRPSRVLFLRSPDLMKPHRRGPAEVPIVEGTMLHIGRTKGSCLSCPPHSQSARAKTWAHSSTASTRRLE